MIVRQLCARHGRAVLSQAAWTTRCFYATSVSDRTLPPSTGDREPNRRVLGHPNDPSSISDTYTLTSTPRTRELEHEIDAFADTNNNLQLDVNAQVSAQTGGVTSNPSQLPNGTGVQTESIDQGYLPSDPRILYVTGFPDTTTREDLIDMFEEHGEVVDIQKPKKAGFAFVIFATAEEAEEVAGLKKQIGEHTLTISTARERKMNFQAQFKQHTKAVRQSRQLGSEILDRYHPDDIVNTPPRIEQVDLPTLLANQTHLGHHTSLWNSANSSYIFGIREGIHIISLDITYAYLKRATKVVEEVARRGGVILFIGTRKGQEDIVVKAASRAGGYHIYSRWVPGTLTNGQQLLGNCAVRAVNVLDAELTEYRESFSKGQHQVVRPDLVVCLNPIENEVCLHECGIYGIPTIGIVDTDANPSWVTYPIPANDDSLRSVALVAGVLSKAANKGQQLRKQTAMRGQSTYDVRPALGVLAALRKISELEVQDQKNQKADKEA